MKPQLSGLFNALGVTAYVSLVATIIINGDRLFGNLPEQYAWLGILLFLLILVASAAITGTLVFGRSVWLYIEGHKQQSLMTLVSTISWLVVMIVIVVTALALINR